MTIRSSSCLWKRTWVKNSRVPWSPKAAKASDSAASGAGAGLDLVGVDGDRARGDPGRAGDHPLPAVLDRLDRARCGGRPPRRSVRPGGAGRAGSRGTGPPPPEPPPPARRPRRVGVDLQDALVVKLHLEVLRPAAVAPQPARLRAHGLLRGSLHVVHYGHQRASSPPRAAHLGATTRQNRPPGPRPKIAATVDRLERAVAERDYETICDQLFTPRARKRAGGAECARQLGSAAEGVRRPRIAIEAIDVEGTRLR